MTKKLILSVLAITLLASCKKEKATESDIIGTWAMRSYNSHGRVTFYTTSDQTPCISNYTWVFRTDNTATVSIPGGAECVLPDGSAFVEVNDMLTLHWSMNGSKVYVNDSERGELVKEDGKLTLHLRYGESAPSSASGYEYTFLKK